MAERHHMNSGKRPQGKPFMNNNRVPQNRPTWNDTSSVDLSIYSCPVCFNIMSVPIYVCESGHSICNDCCTKLMPPICPLCRAPIKQTRNFALESMIEKIRVPCPNMNNGCKYTLMQGQLNKHVAECIFRFTKCIFGEIFGKCAWQGPIQSMLMHCKERHEENTNKINVDSDIVMRRFDSKLDDRILELLEIGPHLCYCHFKVDTLSQNAYWAIQFLGTADFVRNWMYEVHIFNKSEPERKVKFVEPCKPSNLSSKEIFDSGECAAMPLDYLKTFIDARRNLVFKIFIRNKNYQKPKKENEAAENRNQRNSTGP